MILDRGSRDDKVIGLLSSSRPELEIENSKSQGRDLGQEHNDLLASVIRSDLRWKRGAIARDDIHLASRCDALLEHDLDKILSSDRERIEDDDGFTFASGVELGRNRPDGIGQQVSKLV
jgi:hypothetical protein